MRRLIATKSRKAFLFRYKRQRQKKQSERLTALSKSGSVRMPKQETFFATRFGMLVDQFGIPWMINCAPAA